MADWLEWPADGPHWLNLGEWVERFVNFIRDSDGGSLERMGNVIKVPVETLEIFLNAVPWPVMVAVVVAIGLWRVGWWFALFCLVCCLVVLDSGLWKETMATLALIIASTLFSLLLGLPLGIWASKSDRMAAVLRPTLDFMQTMPAFVYLIPAALILGLGPVPAMLSTVVFAMPPVVRLTNLGIRQVNREQVEAGITFGCTPSQVLWKVQIPGAMPSIMAGINQTIMMALSMVIIASMVGAGGLGNEVLRSINNMNIRLGFESGLAVVLLAIMVDRITETFGQPGKRRTLKDKLGLSRKKDPV